MDETTTADTPHATGPSASRLPRTAMIGVGSMGGAILAGLRAPEADIVLPITVTTKSKTSAQAFAGASDVVALSSERDPEANRRAVRGAELVVLGVKPWMMRDVVREIASDLEPGAVVVSVAAGVPSAAIEAELPEGVAVVRAMPNTPSTIGLGATGIAGGASAREADVALVQRMFATVGEALIVREDQINAVAAVSGSGPAYLFLYAEEMTAAAERAGFDEDQARTLVKQTIVGAAQLWAHSDESPDVLRRKVTSPKGTTEQAVLELQRGGWAELFDRALAANVRRSEEIERGE